MKRLAVLACAAACITLAASSSSTEAGGKITRLGTEVCAVNPNPVSNGQQFFITGTGFRPGQVLNLRISGMAMMTSTDSTGSFSTWSWAQFLTSGTKDVNVYQQGDRHLTVLTTCSFYASGKV
jgi:hypothetical protein